MTAQMPVVSTGFLSRLRDRYPPRTVLLGIAAPVGALAFAIGAVTLILLAGKHDPGEAFKTMLDQLNKPTPFVDIINQAMIYYLSAVAVAIGFRMNLFNIGVEGQYGIAVFFAAYVGAKVHATPVIHVGVIILVAMIVGALWAGIAGVLKVTRGVSEVIATIMLNAIAIGVASYLLHRLGEVRGNNNDTGPIAKSGQLGGFHYGGTETRIYGFLVIVVVVGALYWFVMSRTTFGYRVRATGLNEAAAVASGVEVKRLLVIAMLLSGAVAGLVGLPELLGSSHTYSSTTQAGLGFAGIAIALLGRNSAVGMAIAALLWAFLFKSANQLDFIEVPRELAAIIQGVILFSVVVAYELVRRYRLVLQQRDVAKQLAAAARATREKEAVA